MDNKALINYFWTRFNNRRNKDSTVRETADLVDTILDELFTTARSGDGAKQQKTMIHKPEILKIIEAAVECDKMKVIAYSELLASKCSDDTRFQKAIEDRISGEYKNKPVMRLD